MFIQKAYIFYQFKHIAFKSSQKEILPNNITIEFRLKTYYSKRAKSSVTIRLSDSFDRLNGHWKQPFLFDPFVKDK